MPWMRNRNRQQAGSHKLNFDSLHSLGHLNESVADQPVLWLH